MNSAEEANTTELDHPIQWPDKGSSKPGYCHWKNYGEMSPERCEELFGFEGEIKYDQGDILVIGDVLVTPYTLRETRQRIDDEPDNGSFSMDEIYEIRTLKEIDIKKINLLRDFTVDIDDYYDRMDRSD